MNTFLIVDSSHLFHRAKHTVRGTLDERIGMCLHILFVSLSKAWRTQKANHIVFAFDNRSWRKDVYPPYKRNRSEARASATPTEQAEEQLFYDAFNIFKEFVSTKTNCSILDKAGLEADDLVAGFIEAHPNDRHVIVSSDKDFDQLLAPNVSIYNGVADEITTLTGVIDWKGIAITDKKTGEPKPPPDPEWSLFEKAMRGCSTDNIFSAYPGAREKGSRNKVGLREAFEDREKKGFNWSAVTLTRWTDQNGEEHRVLDDYNRNMQLVNLKAQPAEIRKLIEQTVKDAAVPVSKSQIGLHFLKLCGKYELNKVSEQSTNFAAMFSASYPAG